MNILEYKGYLTKIEYSSEDQVLYGKIEGIKDLVNFESSAADEIENEFHNAVDDYLALCAELGQEPDKAYSGTFNVRIPTELHRQVAMYAFRNGYTLNKTVEKAIRQFFNNELINVRNANTTTRSSDAVAPRLYCYENKSRMASSIWDNYSKEGPNIVCVG